MQEVDVQMWRVDMIMIQVRTDGEWRRWMNTIKCEVVKDEVCERGRKIEAGRVQVFTGDK